MAPDASASSPPEAAAAPPEGPSSGDGGTVVEGAGSALETWVIPALIVAVPAILVIWIVLAQLAATSIWLPIVRRTIGPFSISLPFRRRG